MSESQQSNPVAELSPEQLRQFADDLNRLYMEAVELEKLVLAARRRAKDISWELSKVIDAK